MYRRIKHYSVLGVFGIGLVVNAQEDDFSTTTFVGQVGTNLYRTSVHQLVSPVGKQVELPGLRPQAVALSPDGKLLVVSGKTAELKVLDPVTGEILQSVALPSGTAAEPTADITSEHFLLPDKKAQLSFTGLVFSEDGRRLYLSSVNGTIKVFEVDKKGKVTGRNSFNLPPADAPKRKIEIPAGLVLSRDGKKLYVALNLSNRVAEFRRRHRRSLALVGRWSGAL